MNVPFLLPITVWERFNKRDDGRWIWEHNHIEDGHCNADTPTPKFSNQAKDWKNGKWRKFFCYLNELNIVV